MSSKAKKIQNNVENTKKVQLYELYNTLCGSIIVSVGKLVNKTEDEMIEDFARFSKDEELAKSKNIKDACDYIIKDFGMADCFKKNIVLVYDENDLYTPIITLEVDDTILPLDPNGMTLGILNHLDNAIVEYIYDEDEDCIEG